MSWIVLFHDEFSIEFDQLEIEVQYKILEKAKVLEILGPQLGRPYVDQLNGSNYPNMKELRINGPYGIWRIAFAFDPSRNAILLVAGDKGGQNEKRFYKILISKADKRYQDHLNT